jgi:hypothetical protein
LGGRVVRGRREGDIWYLSGDGEDSGSDEGEGVVSGEGRCQYSPWETREI